MTSLEEALERGPPYTEIELDWWDELEAQSAAEESLAEGWFEASIWLRQQAAERLLTDCMISNLHQLVFQRLFPDFAGRFRGPAPNYLPTNVSFGQHRGTPHEEVPAEMERLAAGVENLIAQLDDLQVTVEHDDLIPEVLKAAAWTHCELVRIHPFPNGNGRISRIAINYFCYRYGLLSIAIERPRSDYIDAIRAWLYYRKIEPLADLLASLVQPRTSDSHTIWC